VATKHLSAQNAVRDFLLAKQADGLSPRTVETHDYHLKRFLKSQNPATVDDITPATLRAYLTEMRSAGLAAHTIHGAARTLKCFCRWLEREGICESPWRNVKMPAFPKEILPPFSQSDVKAILAACDNQRDKALVMVALDTGLRLAELAGLTVGDIDLQSGAVFVRLGKGGKTRTVVIGAKTRQAIARLLRTLDGEALWQSPTGTALSARGVAEAIERIGKRAGVKPCNPHRFRRSFAIACLRSGMDVYSLQRLMGHADLTVLQKYLDLVTGDLQRSHAAHSPLDQMLK